MRVGSENMENLMTVVDRLDELQTSSVGRRESVAARDSERETHGRPCRHIQSALPTGDGLWPLPRHVSWRSRTELLYQYRARVSMLTRDKNCLAMPEHTPNAFCRVMLKSLYGCSMMLKVSSD